MGDQRSNGLQDSTRAANFTIEDRRSSGLQRNTEVENAQKTWRNRPRKRFMQENSRQVFRQSSVGSVGSEQNRDMVTGANLTPHMIAAFLTGRPMQSREPLQHHNPNNDESQDTIPQVPETTAPTTSLDPINRLAEVLVGLNRTPSQHDYADV